MRCLTLARELKDQGWHCTFVCREHKGHLGTKILHEGHQCILLPNNPAVAPSANGYTGWCGETLQKDAQQTLEEIGNNWFDWLIVDHYELDVNWETFLRKRIRKSLVIDDLADRQHDCDILLDQTPCRRKEDYQGLTPAHCRLLLGSRYALLRKEFSRSRPKALKRRGKQPPSSVLLSLGGTDPNNLTLTVLQELEHSLLPDGFNLTVLSGSIPAHRKSAQDFAASSRLSINVLESTDNVAELLSEADLAIGAAGGSSWERASLGLPSILLQTAENQLAVFKVLTESQCVAGITEVAGLSDALSDLQSRYRALSIRSASLVDGGGTFRVVQALEDKLPACTFGWRPVTTEDKPLLAKLINSGSGVSEPDQLLDLLLSVWSVCLIVESGDDICGLVAMDLDADCTRVYFSFDQNSSPLDAEIFALLQLEALASDSIKYSVSGDISNYPGVTRSKLTVENRHSSSCNDDYSTFTRQPVANSLTAG